MRSARAAVKPLVLLTALVAAPLAAQQQGVATEPTPVVPATAVATPTPKPSTLYESNTPAPGTIAEAQEADAAVQADKKHTVVFTTLALVVVLVVLIFVL